MNRPLSVVCLGVGCLLVAGWATGCKTTTDRAVAGAATVDALLAAGRDVAPASDGDGRAEPAWARAEIERIAARVRAERQRNPALPLAEAMNRTLFDVLAFQREVDDQALRFVLLPSVLRQHRGSCVGLGVLYLALAAALQEPAAGVVVPGHFFVRLGGGDRPRNVELLRRGEEMPDDWYRGKYPIAGGGAPAYARALTTREVVGVVEYNVGQQWRQQARLGDARRAYQRAAEHFPDFAEAQASLGTTLHLLGELDAAAAAYAQARQAQPLLPGLTNNIILLERERASHPTAPTATARSHPTAAPGLNVGADAPGQ